MRADDVRRRMATVMGVVLVHGMVVVVWTWSSTKRTTPPVREIAITVALKPMESPPQSRSETLSAVPRALPPSLLVIPPTEQETTWTPTNSPGWEHDWTRPRSDGSSQQAEGPSSASSAPGGPLVLTPSKEAIKGAFANPAVVDPRANSPRPNAEERMAMAIDPSLCLKVDRDPDGTERRSWSHYTEVVPAITQQTGLKGKPVRVCA